MFIALFQNHVEWIFLRLFSRQHLKVHNLVDKKLFVDEKMTSKEFPLKNVLFIWIKRFNFLSMNLKLLCAYFSLV